MPVFVNTANIVVKSYTVLYLCVEVMICQSERSPERLLISQTPMIGGTSNYLSWENECGAKSPSFLGEFCKTLPTQNRIFLTFPNCGILDLPHVCIFPLLSSVFICFMSTSSLQYIIFMRMSSLQYTIFSFHWLFVISFHFLLSSLCNWPSLWVHAAYNIPFVVVKSMSPYTPKLQLLHNTERPTKWSGHGNMIHPHENFYIWKTFYPGG